MKKTTLRFRLMAKGLPILFLVAIVVVHSSSLAQTIGIQSAIVQPGDTIAIPVEISTDILDVYGFQLDLQVTPSAGAPDLTIDSMAKGAAVNAQDKNGWSALMLAAGAGQTDLASPPGRGRQCTKCDRGQNHHFDFGIRVRAQPCSESEFECYEQSGRNRVDDRQPLS